MTTTLPSVAAPLKIGTRGSPLALAQAFETQRRLAHHFELPEEAFEISVISTTGDDRSLIEADRPLKEIGNKGLFTKEIEEALIDGRVDIAVHSMKDMPTVQPDGLIVDCALPREDMRDAFVSHKYSAISDLPEGATVGTSSLRRRAQLLNSRPDLKVVEFRGNLQTRLQKLKDGVADATFLAMAGLNRLDLVAVPKTAIEPDVMLPAVAQGAICIERRADDYRTEAMLAAIHNAPTWTCVAAERAFLAELDGSCETPIAALAEVTGETMTLRGEILLPDGTQAFAGSVQGPMADGPSLGRALAQDLLSQAGSDFFAWRG